MRRPPEKVALVARHHWLTGGAMLCSIAIFYAFTRNVAFLPLSFRGYAIALSIGAFYLLAGAMVWFGAPLGRVVNYVCSLIYLTRPQLGLRIWRISDSPEFKAHFVREKSGTK